MLIQRHNNKKQKKQTYTMVILIACGVLLFGLSLWFWFSHRQSSVEYAPSEQTERSFEINNEAPTDAQRDAGNKSKQDFLDKESRNSDSENNSNSAIISISSISQADDVLRVRALVDGAEANGGCVLSLIKGATVISKSSSVQDAGAYVICKGFDVPLSELTPGEWTVSMKYESLSGGQSVTEGQVTIHE